MAKVGETLTAKVTPEKATVNYQWMRADAEDGTYVDIAGATDSTYELVAADVGKYIKVKATGTGNYKGTVESKPVGPVKEAEEEPVVPETASFVAKNSFGINDNKVYAGYELQDGDGNQIPLIENNIESITVLEPGAEEPKNLTVVGNEDPLLWFNIAKEAGTYTYTVVTKGEDSKAYEATIEWTAPAEATVNFQAPADASDVFTEADGDNSAQVDFSKVTADKLLDWTSTKDGYYAIELKIADVDLSEGNVKKAFRVYEDGTAIEPEIKGDLDTQYVTTLDWELGTATMYYVLADNSLHQAKINVVNLTPKTALPAQSTYKLTHTELADSYTAGDLIEETEQAAINTAVEAAIEGLEPIKVTLATDVLGQTGYDAVRIAPVGAEGNIQLWAKDTSNNWYNINVTGWGDADGFALPANYDVTTDVYVLSDAVGDYTLDIKLVNVSNNDEVIAEISGTVKVSTVQVADESGLNTALADNNVKTIKFAGDITLNQQVNIARDIVIDGQNHKLSNTATYCIAVNEANINVTIKNVHFNNCQNNGIRVFKAARMDIEGCIFTDVHRCIVLQENVGITADDITITGNAFNLGAGKRAVSYPVAVKENASDVAAIRNNNTFNNTDGPDYDVRYYSGTKIYYPNKPLIDTTDIITIDGTGSAKVENRTTGGSISEDNHGTITVTLNTSVEKLTVQQLITALDEAKDPKGYVTGLIVKDSSDQALGNDVELTSESNVKIYIKSFDEKETTYYTVTITSNGN